MTRTVQAAGKTDIGCVRANNEDSFGYDIVRGVFVLCDGMGGATAGEIASSLAVETILDYFRDSKIASSKVEAGAGGLSEPARALSEAIQLANQAVYQEASRNLEHSGMGTTVVAVLFGDKSFSVGHLGDSRLYLVRGDTIQQLTADHSVVMEQVRYGLITLEQARNSRMQNLVTRALGVRPTADLELETHPMRAEDVLLLCSDGLSRFVPENQMLDLIVHSKELQQCCESLVDTAKVLGSDDNITCILVRLGAEA